MATDYTKLMDEIARSNRERYMAEVRRFWQSIFGYDPGPGFGDVQQDARPNAGVGQKVRDIYSRISARKGGGALDRTDPDLISTVVAETGLTPEQALALFQQGHDYYVANQAIMPDEAIEAIVSQALPYGRYPTQEARQFSETLGENQRQFDTSQRNAIVQNLIAATARGGPADYYQTDRQIGMGRDFLETLGGSQARPAGGFAGRPQRVTTESILKKLGLLGNKATVVGV